MADLRVSDDVFADFDSHAVTSAAEIFKYDEHAGAATVADSVVVVSEQPGIVGGDYILADGSHAGYAKAKSEVSFEEFRDKVVGTAWESKGEEAGKVLVAVGVK